MSTDKVKPSRWEGVCKVIASPDRKRFIPKKISTYRRCHSCNAGTPWTKTRLAINTHDARKNSVVRSMTEVIKPGFSISRKKPVPKSTAAVTLRSSMFSAKWRFFVLIAYH